MDMPLRVLIIEDSERDVALEVRALKATGYEVAYVVAETAVEMKAALAEQTFDIVISDHDLPQFDAPGALAVLKQSGLDIPFIVVSGSIGEETAVALMRAGAHDYVMKDRLARLVPAVQRELREAESRREQKRAEEALRESVEKYRLFFMTSRDCVFITSKDGDWIDLNDAAVELFGYSSRAELMEVKIPDLYVDPEEWAKHSGIIAENGYSQEFPVDLRRKDGTVMHTLITAVVLCDAEKNVIGYQGTIHDITKRKRAEGKLQQTMDNLRKSFRTTVQVLVSAVESRDPYTAGHQIRSANLARAMATEMGLSQDRVDGIRLAGSIHDIGKLSIPVEILSKPTKLSELEFRLIQEHSLQGYEILKDVESPWPLAEIVHQHHERMDGSGYPRHLKGEEILMEARILAVADVVESMASHRPYRAALGLKVALEEIENNRGTLYDTDAADACLRLFREKDFQFEGT